MDQSSLEQWRTYDKKRNLFRKYPTQDKAFNAWIKLDFNQDGSADYSSPYQLRRELATKQSKTLIRLFKKMKDYIASSSSLITANNDNDIVKQVMKNSNDIIQIKSEMTTKKDLLSFMKNFIDEHIGNEILLMDGKMVEADVAYTNIYRQAKELIYIIDNYIGLKTLLLLKGIKKRLK